MPGKAGNDCGILAMYMEKNPQGDDTINWIALAYLFQLSDILTSKAQKAH